MKTARIKAAIVVALVTGALLWLDRFLAATEGREVEQDAAAAFERGGALLKQGDAERGLDALRRAHSLSRENTSYELALGGALAASHRLDEAAPLIDDALERRATDGAANLAAAHLAMAQGDYGQAESYFHRAIYGEWKLDPARRRIETRLELIELLRKEKKQQEMLAELISLEAEAGNDRVVQRKLARLLMDAGSPSRAAAVYRTLVDSGPFDNEAEVGLGEAELANGRYRAARNAFLRTRGEPVHARLQLVDTLMELDPTPRQLTSLEKYQRCERILELARADLEERARANPPRDSTEVDGLLKRAAETIARKEPRHVTNEIAESVLVLAEEIWRVRVRTFGDSGGGSEALRLLMERMAG